MTRDRVFARKRRQIQPFSFNREVAEVFEDMLVRSVPLYKESVRRQAELAWRFYRPGTRIYDLGCSHGNFGVRLQALFRQTPFTLVGVDTSRPMLEKYKNRLGPAEPGRCIHLVCGAMEDICITNASVVVINLTLQFLNPAKREDLICRIFSGMVPGGILLLMEKTVHPEPAIHGLQLDVYQQFKRENGYSDLEISQKRDALEKVLIPDTLDTHFQRLHRAGFSHVDVWLKWFNFSAIMAVKEGDTHGVSSDR
ncbi:MAG: carboxy-S-adenosyl-L-methionine synthase CmoA [Desulfobacteraceae bacterium]|nr:carboxy-S-adenosyl-L-methionine synthase CmoA [Desulfobacteraceae bacterium]